MKRDTREHNSASSKSGLNAENVTHAFGGRKVLDASSITVPPGRIVGLIGPSGAGKTTVGRILSGRIPADGGVVSVDGAPIMSRCVPEVAYLGQAPREACNPRWTLRRIISEPVLIAQRNQRNQRSQRAQQAQSSGSSPAPSCDVELVDRVAAAVLLDDTLLNRTPEEVSDGQLQRAVIARALAQRPRYFVCDEPTSMLDPITTAAVIKALRAESTRVDDIDSGAGLLFISHDLRLLNVVADDIYQLVEGKITSFK